MFNSLLACFVLSFESYTVLFADQDIASQKAKRKARRRKNSTTTIASEGQTDIEYVSDSSRGPGRDEFDGVLGATSR
jgi:hypothetical protein